MRALCYTDLQATEGHERCFTDPSKPLQIYRIEKFFDQICQIYGERKCDALWDLGDTTDDRNSVPVPVIDLMCDRLEPFTGHWNLKLVGNHEQFMRDTRIHAGKMFRHFFQVIDKCCVLKCENVNIICVSYHDDQNAVLDFLRRNRGKTPNLLLGHFEVFGCSLKNGLSAGGIARSELNFVNIGLLGHIHKPQSLGALHYVGSPFQQDWGESGENKRVAILDISGDKVSLEWVPLEGFPIYRQVSYEEFTTLAQKNSEDRYKVVLRSPEETAEFYAHPLANRADEAIYDYQQAESNTVSEETVAPRTKRDIMKLYLAKTPPSAWNITVSEEDMLSVGERIASGIAST